MMDKEKMPKNFKTYWYSEKEIPPHATEPSSSIAETNNHSKWSSFLAAIRTSIENRENKETSKK